MHRPTLCCALFVFASGALLGQAKPAAQPTDLHWGPAPAVFPAGAEMAVVTGDPSKAAPFVVELRMPDGYRLQPHFHPTEETVEVKRGTFLYGMGDTFDVAKTKPMHVGDKGTIPATMHHFATARGRTIVMVSSMGPFVLTYVNPADDPQTHAPKP
ncbi:MAG TPA: cupin domain-containing protein [Gemmatimonadales bacterium]|nr:cupin domain-containing protein [Gemmatimonadales bacterium]